MPTVQAQQSDIEAFGFNQLVTKADWLSGIGAGDYGYGQGFALGLQTQGNTILRDPIMPNLYASLQRAYRHQTGAASDLSAEVLPPVAVGDTIYADVYNKYSNVIDSLYNSRLTAAMNSVTLVQNVYTNTRPTAWRTINGIFDVLWGTENAARHYFNTGGEVRLRLAHPYRYDQYGVNSRWTTNLNAIGTIRVKAHGVIGNNTKGVLNNIGFYEAIGSEQVLFNGENIDSDYWRPGYAPVDDVYVYITKIANGLRFRAYILEQNTRGNPSGGTTIYFDTLRATTFMQGIAAPSFVARATL